jgi:hypothetical protein
LTILVPLTLAIQASKYDEVAIYNYSLSASQFADHYAGAALSYSSDPQDALQWEEVYGSDYPLTAGDAPVIQNGLCRVRYVSATQSFAVDAFLPGIGWQEQGRVTTWFDDSGAGTLYTQQGGLQAAEIVEWTPERGVIQVNTVTSVSSIFYRMETYISLQRGWTGPRFEIYPSPRGGVKLGTRLVFTSVRAANVGAFNPGGGFAADPWAAIVGGPTTVTVAWLRAVDTPLFFADSTAYAASRTAVAVSAAQNTSGAGYGSIRLGFGARAFYQEAEIGAALASTSLLADATASGSFALNTTLTGITAPAVQYPAASIGRVLLGKYQMWARVRVGTSGDTMTVRSYFSDGGANSSQSTLDATTTSTSYVWVYVGELTRTLASQYLEVDFWRSAGTGTAGEWLDQVALVPVERRVATDPAYDGARDLAQATLYDSRAVPELVAR